MDILTAIKEDRLLKLLFSRSRNSKNPLLNRVVDYSNWYFSQLGLSESEVIESYKNFIESYNSYMKSFLKTNKYPFELEGNVDSLDRNSYDIILLMSIIVTKHRLRIMEYLQENLEQKFNNGLIIGCGPGFEIAELKDQFESFDAYDISINNILLEMEGVNFHEEYFDGLSDKKYDRVYLIEILEHMKDPFELLESSKKVLSPSGQIICTTATNIPQFDHYYNFSKDHVHFESQLKSMGLHILDMENVVHNYFTVNVESKNRIYRLKA